MTRFLPDRSHLLTHTSKGSPVAGWLLEMYGGSDAGITAYRPAMYYAGSLSLGAAGFVGGMRWLEAPRLLAFA